jgi:coproporphyrinogen III oxidase
LIKNNQSQAMNLKEKQQLTANWFKNLRDQICAEFEKIEAEFNQQNPGKFIRKNWNREGGGSGEMSVMKGNVF